MDPLPISEDVLRDLLKACTKEAPFLSHRGELFRQVDGVAMGSPLGVLFANMYMATVEERTFSEQQKPKIYGRYIDDIFITVQNNEDAINLREKFKNNSVLNFTIENSDQKTLPFLDVLISQKDERFFTTVYTKATNTGRCLNAKGECPESYKRSVVNAYVNRAFTHCTTWKNVHTELDRIRQLLTNNGYPDCMIEDSIKKKMNEFCLKATSTMTKTTREENLIIYHRLTYGSAYKEECETLQRIVNRGIVPKAPYKKIQLRIHSKPNLVASMLMKNSTAPKLPKDECTNVVYKFSCPEEMCQSHLQNYVGHTRTTIRRRMSTHRNRGAIHQHFIDIHDRKPTLPELIENTQVIHRESNFSRLLIAEAVSICIQKPTLNIQQEADNILPSSRGRRPARESNLIPPSQTSNDMPSSNEVRVSAFLRTLRPRFNRNANSNS